MTSLAREWELAAEMMREIQGNRTPEDDEYDALEAEGRWLAVDYVRRRMGMRVLAWRDYERQQRQVFEHVDDHACMGSTCAQTCTPPGTHFIDPQSGRPFTASGNVYVCCTTGAAHICTPVYCRLEAESEHDRGTTLCPVSGRYKAAMLESGESFREREARMADPRPPAYKRTITREGSTKRPRIPPDRSAHAQRDAARICERLVRDNPILAALQQRLYTADADALRVVSRATDHGRINSVRALTELLVAHYEAAKLSTVKHMEALATTPLPADTADYLVRCVCELFQLVRESGSNKDANLRKLCVPLLYTMLRGLVGVVETCRTTGKIMDRRVMPDDGRVLTSSDDDDRALVVRYWVFVPAHAWLGALLPADDQALPAVDEWGEELANQMKRGRHVHQAFLSAMGDGTKDVSRFCLPTRVPALRTHVT